VALALLANVLFKNHGLTIQEGKTEIVDAKDFVNRFAMTEDDEERNHLGEWFHFLTGTAGLNTYEPIAYEDLTPELQTHIDELNLWDIVADTVRPTVKSPSPNLISFVLRRIAQLGLRDEEGVLLSDMRAVGGYLKEIVKAVTAQSGLSSLECLEIGARLIQCIDDEAVGHLEYHRAWHLSAFSTDSRWGQSDAIAALLNRFFDSFTGTAVILALGRSRRSAWFRSRKQDLHQFAKWEFRAFLYGASCLPKDEQRFWYSSIERRLDPLEGAVVSFARANPIA